MRVLLTNDDGIRAPGIVALHGALAADPALGEVFTCAPLTVQSATSHGVTVHEPLMTTEVEFAPGARGVAVDGRPADCVKLAVCSIWPERFGEGSRPDLVVSGMNAGANVGINVIYSGTVAAALEAAFLGLPSIAVSLHLGDREPRFDVAARRAREAIDLILERGSGLLAPGLCVNVNIPLSQEEGPSPELCVCPMNTHGLVDAYERRESPAGDVYYWPSGHGLDFRGADAGSDVDQLFERRIVVTPLTHDLTDARALGAWREAFEGDKL